MLRHRGHEVRAAFRLSEDLERWAQGIVRFAPYPGPPARDEAEWYTEWLARGPERWLIYVVCDFTTEAEYWSDVRAGSPVSDTELRTDAEEKRIEAADWVFRLPPKARNAAEEARWFVVDRGWIPPRTCTKLNGPWAEGIDTVAAALPLHEPLRQAGWTTLLGSDGQAFVLGKASRGRNRILAIANGSFLLNAALANPARHALARKVVEWHERAHERIAMIEGRNILAAQQEPPTLWELLHRLPKVRWIAIQLGLAGLFAALARAPRLGRARPAPAPGADRPAAHAEAIGALLASTRSTGEARKLLDRYRNWRHPSAGQRRSPAGRP
jgi:hypothetical protein